MTEYIDEYDGNMSSRIMLLDNISNLYPSGSFQDIIDSKEYIIIFVKNIVDNKISYYYLQDRSEISFNGIELIDREVTPGIFFLDEEYELKTILRILLK